MTVTIWTTLFHYSSIFILVASLILQFCWFSSKHITCEVKGFRGRLLYGGTEASFAICINIPKPLNPQPVKNHVSLVERQYRKWHGCFRKYSSTWVISRWACHSDQRRRNYCQKWRWGRWKEGSSPPSSRWQAIAETTSLSAMLCSIDRTNGLFRYLSFHKLNDTRERSSYGRCGVLLRLDREFFSLAELSSS